MHKTRNIITIFAIALAGILLAGTQSASATSAKPTLITFNLKNSKSKGYSHAKLYWNKSGKGKNAVYWPDHIVFNAIKPDAHVLCGFISIDLDFKSNAKNAQIKRVHSASTTGNLYLSSTTESYATTKAFDPRVDVKIAYGCSGYVYSHDTGTAHTYQQKLK